MPSLALARGFKAAEYAPGIPDKKQFSPLPSVRDAKWQYVLHAHKADRAGPHLDLRLGDPSTGVAHSFAYRGKGLPAPGQRQLVIEQPDHTLEYMKFRGRIERGYGKGDVDIAQRGKAHVLDSEPGKLHFRVGGSRYVLVATPKYKKRSWLLIGLRGAPKKAS
jgi:hypothetical protein